MFHYKILFIPCITLFLFSCHSRQGGNVPHHTTADSASLPVVLVATPERHNYSNGFDIAGNALPDQQVKIYAMTNGYVQTLKADIGSFVKTGQLLAVLDNPELKGQIQKVQADLQSKETIYDRLKSIYAQTPALTTIIDVQNAEAAYKIALSQWNILKTQVAYLQVKAPFNGVIIKRYADKGALVQNGLNNAGTMPLFDLQEIDIIRATADIPESIVPLIHENTKVDILFPELPGAVYKGSITRMAYGMDENTKTMTVQTDLKNTDYKIRPGMYAQLHFHLQGHPGILSVPNEALGYQQDRPYVYKVVNGIVARINVQTGLHDADFTEIMDAALHDTDKVIVQGKDLVSDGARVIIKEKLSSR